MVYAVDDHYRWINDVFKKLGPLIFKDKQFKWPLFGPKYSNENLSKMLSYFLKDKKLSDIKDIELVITSTDFTLTQPRIFDNINLQEGQDILLRDIGLCTSAAPTFFPAQEVKWSLNEKDLESMKLSDKILSLAAFEKSKINNRRRPDKKLSSLRWRDA